MAMDWVAALAPGSFYGPIHGSALRELLADGSVNADAALFRRTPLDELEGPAAAEELAGLRELAGQLRELGAEQEGQLRQARERLEASAAEIGALRRQVADTAEKARLEVAKALEQARLQVAESETAAGEARRLLREQAEQAQEQRRLDAARAAALEGELGQVRRDLALVAEQAQEQRRLDAARAAALEDELAQARRQLAEVAARSDKVQAEAEGQARLREAERSGFAERELAALEEARCAKARAAEMEERVTALERELAVARQAVLSVEDGMPGGVTADFDAAGQTVEYIEAAPLDAADGPQRVNKRDKFVEDADVLPPENGAREKPNPRVSSKGPAAGSRSTAGLSMSALEAQARRELEMLGADAKMFFSKHKK